MIRFLAKALVLTSALTPAVAFAQETQSPQNAPSDTNESSGQEDATGGISEIIVTANKREESLSKVPLSITAATGETLQNLGITSPEALVNITPGLTFSSSIHGTPIYTLRGVGGFIEALAFSPNVSVYVDQVPLAYTRLTQGAALDPERVEILKGPQGTLFGQNSTGGAINYIAAKPTDSFEAGLDLTYGRFNEFNAGGFASGPLTDNLRARVSFRSEHRGGWQYQHFIDPRVVAPNEVGTNGVRDFSAARILLDWEPTPELTFELNLNAWFDRSDLQAKRFVAYLPLVPGGGTSRTVDGIDDIQSAVRSYPVAPEDPRAAGWDAGASQRRDDEFYQVALRIGYVLSDTIDLTSISAYTHANIFGSTEPDGLVYALADNGTSGSFETFSQEVRLAGSAFEYDRLKWMIGGSYGRDKVADDQLMSIFTSNTGVTLPAALTTQPGGIANPDGTVTYLFNDWINYSRQRMRTLAVFGSLTFDLTDRLTIEGSARYTDRHNSSRACVIDPNGPTGGFAQAVSALSQVLTGAANPPVPVNGCITLNENFTYNPEGIYRHQLNEDNVSYRGSLSWRPTDDHMIYISATKGYKAGTFENLTWVTSDQIEPVPQESVMAYEAGFKSFFLGRAVQLEGAAFYYDYRDKQLADYVNNFVFGTLPAIVSIPKSTIMGFEGTLRAQPVDGLDLMVGATYLDSEVEESYVTPGLIGVPGDIKGSELPLTPKWQVVASADYSFPISNRLQAFVGASGLYHSSSLPAFRPGQYVLPSYTTLDLRAGIETDDGRYRLEAWGRNITNESYLTMIGHADTLFSLTGMPATYGLTFRTRFY
ncbi:hypothetical protein A3711_07290 [Erythrobacter sp. HI00D59]|jgi:outer membrane receptor protein involved in Fe transport|nr:hypothetical protein A3711_07290 [Erythrobacter sp. HI00D59]